MLATERSAVPVGGVPFGEAAYMQAPDSGQHPFAILFQALSKVAEIGVFLGFVRRRQRTANPAPCSMAGRFIARKSRRGGTWSEAGSIRRQAGSRPSDAK